MLCILDVRELEDIFIFRKYDFSHNRFNIKDATAGRYGFQISKKRIFPWAKDIFETFQREIIPNPCPHIIRGPRVSIEFDFFNYDSRDGYLLKELSEILNERVVFLGIAYEIVGNWLVGESGKIYFRDIIRDCRINYMAYNIYELFQTALYDKLDMFDNDIFR